MGYRTEQLGSGALLVKDVPLMGPQKLTEKHFKVKDIDRGWMQRALDTFTANKAKGKMPYLWDRHNSREQAAQVIGRLDNLRIDQLEGADWLFADVIITDPAHKQKFLEGKSPSKSVEYQPDNYYLRGLALLDGHEGHFDFEVPDFVPAGLYDELVALGLNAECTVLCHSSATTAKGNDMDMEALKALLAENNKQLLAEVDKKLSAAKPTVGVDVDEALRQVEQQKEAEKQVALARVQREAKINAYAAQLTAKTKTPEALVKRKLESFKTDEGMDEYFKNSMKNAEEDVKLGIEREHGDSPDLRAEFDAFKARYRDEHGVELRQSFDDYKRLANSLTSVGLRERADRHNSRGVVQLGESTFA